MLLSIHWPVVLQQMNIDYSSNTAWGYLYNARTVFAGSIFSLSTSMHLLRSHWRCSSCSLRQLKRLISVLARAIFFTDLEADLQANISEPTTTGMVSTWRLHVRKECISSILELHESIKEVCKLLTPKRWEYRRHLAYIIIAVVIQGDIQCSRKVYTSW